MRLEDFAQALHDRTRGRPPMCKTSKVPLSSWYPMHGCVCQAQWKAMSVRLERQGGYYAGTGRRTKRSNSSRGWKTATWRSH